MSEVKIIRKNISARATSEPCNIESIKDKETQKHKYEKDRSRWNEALEKVDELEL